MKIMKKTLVFLLLLFAALSVKAQSNTKLIEKDIKEYEDQVKSMVDYLCETLNFLGNPNNPVYEKDIILKDSYSKIFRDDKVQVEDDLDETRSTLVNKDVQAYLKDIDFFFLNATFDFNIENIKLQTNEKGEPFFKVSMIRTLTGRTITGDSINNSKNRFLEINIDPYKKGLKIVSFYTTKLNKIEELQVWWNSMPVVWKDYFGRDQIIYDTIAMSSISKILDNSFVIPVKRDVILKDSFMIVGNNTMKMSQINELYGHRPDTVIFIDDTVSWMFNDTIKTDLKPVYDKLKHFTNKTDVDISGDTLIDNLEPLSELTNILYLNCSNTLVSDINPIRNLNEIIKLDISHTNITDISNLKYINGIQNIKADSMHLSDISVVGLFNNLNNLSISNTDVYDISSLSGCNNLSNLNISNTKIKNLEALKDLKSLSDLNIGNNRINDLSPLQGLVNLQFLNIDKTDVIDLSPLSGLDKLNELSCCNTEIKSLEPLNNLPHLNKIYCDSTFINKETADIFMSVNPRVLVIYETHGLELWWNDLPEFWKEIFAKQNNIKVNNPTTEELHSIINTKTLKVNDSIDINPVSRLTNLEKLDLSDSKIEDLSPLYGLYHLKNLNLKNTSVSDLSPLENLLNLCELNIEDTKVSNLKPLENLSKLEKILADGSMLTDKDAINLKMKNNKVKIIYQTASLRLWWDNLSPTWREIFGLYVDFDINLTAEQLQAVVDLENIEINSSYFIQDIEPLSKMRFLKKLVVNNNQIRDLRPLENDTLIKELSISGNPIDDLSPIKAFGYLKVLNIENTPVDNLNPLSSLKNLKTLNIGGTSVKNLKPLSNCIALEDISIINTQVKKLSPIENIQSLKHIKAYKSKVSQKNIDKLKQKRSELNILYY